MKQFTKLFSAQSLDDMKRYFQGGSVAAYQHVAMLKLHYKIAYALDECLATLEHDESPNNLLHRRRSQMLMNQSSKPGGLNFATLSSTKEKLPSDHDSSNSSSLCDDEYDEGGFDGVECAFGPGRRS